MTTKSKFQESIGDLIAGQLANASSPQAAKLATEIKAAVRRFREDGGENENALSIDATHEDGEFTARVAFREDSRMTIMYQRGSDDATVSAIYLGLPEADDELCRLAGLMLSEGWVEGYDE